MSDLITLSDPRSTVSEAYRSLRTNLDFARPESPLRTLLVASPTQDEDPSTPLANLAVVAAQAGRSVIVVDCDLRRPSQHRRFDLPNDRGVTTVLVDDRSFESLPLQATEVDGLRVLTSGPVPPNPAELLGTRRMAALIEALSADADLVLFAAPPIVAVTDAAVLAPHLDGTLLVLEAGRSRRDRTQRAHELLTQVGAQVIGVVLTGAERERGGEYYGAEAS